MSCMTTDCTDPPPGDDLDRSVSGMLRIRRVVIGVLVTVFLALPAVALFRHAGPQRGCGLPGSRHRGLRGAGGPVGAGQNPSSPAIVRCGTWPCCG